MAYYTKFSLKISTEDLTLRNIILSDLYFNYNILVDDDRTNVTEEYMKWYLHEDDMLELSEKYPNILLSLTGLGEEPGAIWIKYFKEGRTYMDLPIFPDFDENKLKDIQ